MFRITTTFCITTLVCAAMTGCGEKMGDVHGKLVFEGKPVPVGNLTFAPEAPKDQFEAGRPSSGTAEPNGEFKLSTFKKHDGALVGTHRVVYSPPGAPEASSPEERQKPAFIEEYKNYKKYSGLRLPEGFTVEVKPGKNEITLELKRGP